MKDLVNISKKSWLNNIPLKWEVLRVKNLFEISKEKNDGEELPVLSLTQKGIKIRDISDNEGQIAATYENYTRIRKDDIVFNPMDLRTGAVDLSIFDGVISLAYTTIREKKKNKSILKYYKYYFQWYYLHKIFFPFGQGVSVDHRWTLKDDILMNFPVLVPPLETQKKIADFLDEKTKVIDELVAKKEELILRQNEKICSLILGNDGETSGGIGFWNNIKPGWKMEKAKWIFNEIVIRNRVNEELLAVTQNKGVIPKQMCEEKFVSPLSYEGLKLVEKYDFVISLRSFEGGIEFSNYKGIVSPAYTVIRLKPKYNTTYYQKFYKYLLKTPQFIVLLNTIIMGIRDGKNVNYSDFKELVLPIPTEESIKTIMKEFEKYEKLATSLDNEKSLLQEYRSSLIYSAVTGKIKV